MRAVVQRVSESKVVVDEKCVGKIQSGLVVLLGIQAGDNHEDVAFLADKIIHLRIFEDQAGKMNRSLLESNGQMLLISQFTLLADCSKGRRPNFLLAEKPATATRLVDDFRGLVTGQGIDVQTGIFGADMKVHLVNDGPVTITLDSRTHRQDRK
jgi:D-aminoacyl-tRNA deacylase